MTTKRWLTIRRTLRHRDLVSHAAVKRRDFLELAALGALGSVLPLRAETRLLPIGLQLYTVRDLMQASVSGTLEQVAKVGYREVEFAGYHGTPPARLRGWLDTLGLRAPAAHADLLTGNHEEIFDAAAELGHRYVVQASLPLSQQRSLDAFRRTAETLNRAGQAARSRGLSVAYHNHDFEFRPTGGIVPYDVLLAETDPSLVGMEVDLYWMAKADRDPFRYFAAHPRRFPLCHLKDIDNRGRIADVGAGRLDFQRILAQRGKAGIQHLFVEHDHSPDPLHSIRVSYQYLRGLT